MKISVLAVASGILAATAVISSAQTAGEQKMYTPQEIKWSAGPASLPAGAEMAVLYGDPGKEELFALRLKVPKGYRVARWLGCESVESAAPVSATRLRSRRLVCVFPAQVEALVRLLVVPLVSV